VSATKLHKRKRRPAPLATQHADHRKSLTATQRFNIPSKNRCKVLNSQNQETCLCINSSTKKYTKKALHTNNFGDN